VGQEYSFYLYKHEDASVKLIIGKQSHFYIYTFISIASIFFTGRMKLFLNTDLSFYCLLILLSLCTV